MPSGTMRSSATATGSLPSPAREHLNSVGGGARVNWDRFVLDAALAVPLTHVGPLNSEPDPRVPHLAHDPPVAMEILMTTVAYPPYPALIDTSS